MSAKEYAWKKVHMLRASARPDYLIVNAWGREFRIVPTEREIRDVARSGLSEVTVEFVHLRSISDPAPALDKVCTVAGTDSNNAPSEGAGAPSDDPITLVVPADDLAEVAPAPRIRARSSRRGT